MPPIPVESLIDILIELKMRSFCCLDLKSADWLILIYMIWILVFGGVWIHSLLPDGQGWNANGGDLLMLVTAEFLAFVSKYWTTDNLPTEFLKFDAQIADCISRDSPSFGASLYYW